MLKAKEYSAGRAKDRKAMIEIVAKILAEVDDKTIERESREREEILRFHHHRGLAVTVEFDGDSKIDRGGTFCMAWNIWGSEERLSELFGWGQQASVNPYHFRKCTAFGDGFDDLCDKLKRAVNQMNSGTAYRLMDAPKQFTKWGASTNGAGRRSWFVNRDCQWVEGGVPRLHQEVATDKRGRYRRFSGMEAAQRLANKLNKLAAAS